MNQYLGTSIGRLRLLAFLEGVSLIVLVFVAVPLKYRYGNPAWVQAMGPVHGAFFLLFIINALSVSIQQRWSFRTTTWKVLLASLIPFGTFYVSRKILAHL